ncbi:MAG: hypothetical protein NVS4B13_05290 [Candidatus Elarobacter sp.]
MIPAPHATPPSCYRSIPAYYATHRERGPFRTKLFTDGDYALVEWTGGHAGGQGAFRRRGGRWCVLTNGGGAFSIDDLVQYGVPRANAQRLFARSQRLPR